MTVQKIKGSGKKETKYKSERKKKTSKNSTHDKATRTRIYYRYTFIDLLTLFSYL